MNAFPRLPPTVCDCQSPPPPPSDSYPTVSLWHVNSKSLFGQTTKEVLLSLKALTTVWGLPSCTDIHMLNVNCKTCWYDEMKRFAWFFCKHISGFLFMLYCKLFPSCIYINNGAVLDGKSITTNRNHVFYFSVITFDVLQTKKIFVSLCVCRVCVWVSVFVWVCFSARERERESECVWFPNTILFQ